MDGNPDNIQLINELDKSKTDAWAELRSVAEEMTVEDRNVVWTNGGNEHSLNYPAYSERIDKATNLLYTVGAITPLYNWKSNGLPDYLPSMELSVADAIRAATYIVRSERFGDGAIAKAVEIGLLDSILHSLIKWYDVKRKSLDA
ncbi:hypothetical protein CHH58_15795 [Terribacillus saccharophilus]|uniref:DUF6508 domain-containing protein n=1 Tax=Terribacillus saccharophilus TaxID=361277 RepID=UPI000BA53844|nr:DUF6508 domain-containing protein [Terribacillus saccharophilus]PAF18489.1 hypothetical protein CHH51_07155 [Terribacillus saccharophilus]PAF20410.1 hypothetical protein CHH49_16670 [Terribacillus saccharophilus]PAF35677.1 hypothetical protein CHH58_15795 [Terribacillus saccharophilus]